MQNDKINEALKAKEKYQSAVESAHDYIEHFDLLETITNVGNDEVFTPRKTVTMMLDSLPEEVWTNPNYKWLNPATKNGVFEREIAIRLNEGLKDLIPDEETRKKHILQKMIHAYGQTKFTSNVARRTLYYCSEANKKCDGVKDENDGHYVNGYAIGNGTWFKDKEGNIKTPKVDHWFEGTKGKRKCKFCGIAEDSKYVDPLQREQYAYEFIHYDISGLRYKIKNDFFKGETTMKFDIIIGNPPYQLADGGNGVSAKPIYHLFVEQAMKLNPTYLSMIIPSRWFTGGKGLDEFRTNMLNDKHICSITDYINAKDCFPTCSIGGGVMHFLWDKNYNGDCLFTNVRAGIKNSAYRNLSEFQVFVRYNEALSIIHKVNTNKKLTEIISTRNPFDLASNIRGNSKDDGDSYNLFTKDGVSFYPKSKLQKNIELANHYKVLMSRFSAEHAGEPDKDGMFKVLSRTETICPNDICTDTYLIVGDFKTRLEADNCISFLKTRFVRFLLLQGIASISVTRDKFCFVPLEDFTESWTDEKLYAKYKLDSKEIEYIEKLIKPLQTFDSKVAILEGDDDE